MSIKKYFKSPLYFFLFGMCLLVLMLILEIRNNRFWLNDFKVMFSAAEAFCNNEPVYGTSFGLGTGFFKYSPFTMLCIVPFTFFSFKTASILHFLIISVSALSVIIILENIIRTHFYNHTKQHKWAYLLLFIAVVIHLQRDLHLGNINSIMVLLLTLSLYFGLKNKYILSGLILALVILAKPYFVICIVPFIIFRNFKTVISTMAWGVILVLVSVVIISPSESIVLYKEWFMAMLDHNTYLISHNTVISLLKTYVGISIPASVCFGLLGLTGILSSLYFYKIQVINNQSELDVVEKKNRGLIIHFFLLVAIIPNLLITDTEHFIFAMPFIMILLFVYRKASVWSILVIILVIFLYGGNSTDLLGHDLSKAFNRYGILGLSNLIIIGLVLFFYHKKVKRIDQ